MNFYGENDGGRTDLIYTIHDMNHIMRCYDCQLVSYRIYISCILVIIKEKFCAEIYMPTFVSKEKLDEAIREWEYRHKQRMSYAQLAREAGIHIATFNRLKDNKVIHVALDHLHAIGKVLQCEPSQLIQTNWTTNSIITSQTSKKMSQIEEQQSYEALTKELEENARREYVSKFKDWIVKEHSNDNLDVLLLRPGASLTNPHPDDVQHLIGEYAQEWKKQNPSEVRK